MELKQQWKRKWREEVIDMNRKRQVKRCVRREEDEDGERQNYY